MRGGVFLAVCFVFVLVEWKEEGFDSWYGIDVLVRVLVRTQAPVHSVGHGRVQQGRRRGGEGHLNCSRLMGGSHLTWKCLPDCLPCRAVPCCAKH